MFKWLKSLFGAKTVKEPLILTDPIKTEVKVTERPPAPTPTKPKATKKKAPAKKKATTVDLDSMKKGELLAHAKANGVKANASMNKAEILAAIKG